MMGGACFRPRREFATAHTLAVDKLGLVPLGVIEHSLEF